MTTAEAIKTSQPAVAITLIKAKLITDDEWLRRAIVAIYARQTATEQVTEQTVEHNGIGFNGVDAHILSSFAKQIQKGSKLSQKQLGIARRKMQKYSRQLYKIATA